MNINKKIIYLSLFIVVLLVAITGTTTALMNYKEEVIIDSNSYTTSYLQINNDTSSGNSITFNSSPMEDFEGIEQVEAQTFTISNTGNLPYVFEMQFLPVNNEGVNSKYIKIQVDDYMPFRLSFLNSTVDDNNKETYVRKYLQNYYLLPGESMEVKVKLWLSSDTPNAEIGKNISLSLVVTGYADRIYSDDTPGVLSGEGTKDSPYLIESIEDLVEFKNSVNDGNSYEGKYVKLNGTLDFSSPISYANSSCRQDNEYSFNDECKEITNFDSIGTSSNPFKGVFDGNDNYIMNIPYTTTELVGLFGYVEGGSISNLKVTGSYTIDNSIESNRLVVGGIAAKSKLGEVSNCYSRVNYKVNGFKNKEVVIGGIVGESNGTSIDNNYNYGYLNNNESSNSYVGGIVGIEQVKGDNFNNYNYGYVRTISSNKAYVGGIIGNGYGNNGSYNFGIVTGNTVNLDSYSYVGGIVGYSYLDVSNDDNYGLVMNGSYTDNKYSSSSSLYSYVGGIVGYSNGKVNNSSNYSIIKISNSNDNSSNYVGGIVGYGLASIDMVSNRGNVIASTSNSGNYVGGIEGYLADNQKISNSTNTGNITTNDSFTGGIVGRTGSNCIVSNSSNLGNITLDNKGNIVYIGGIVGYADKLNLVSSSYNDANIKVEGSLEAYIGGIVGLILDNSSVNYTYNKGDIEGDNISTGSIGGIVGSGFNTTVLYDYSAGRITNNNDKVLLGGGIGKLENVSNYLNRVYAISSNASSIGESDSIDKNNSYMVTKAYMMSSDFLKLLNKEEEKWEQKSNINDGLPYLKELVPN